MCVLRGGGLASGRGSSTGRSYLTQGVITENFISKEYGYTEAYQGGQGSHLGVRGLCGPCELGRESGRVASLRPACSRL